VAAFEPRSATACRTLHQEDYAAAFDAADLVLLAPVGRPELAPEEKLDTARLAASLRARGVESHACQSVQEVQAQILGAAFAGDAVALLSNGTFGGIHAALQTALSGRASQVHHQEASS
jgi:UDP-N-acetylmuramate: L-alanyl-gamma-D-glutamyl-meso-diaminopimelate ligase